MSHELDVQPTGGGVSLTSTVGSPDSGAVASAFSHVVDPLVVPAGVSLDGPRGDPVPHGALAHIPPSGGGVDVPAPRVGTVAVGTPEIVARGEDGDPRASVHPRTDLQSSDAPNALAASPLQVPAPHPPNIFAFGAGHRGVSAFGTPNWPQRPVGVPPLFHFGAGGSRPPFAVPPASHLPPPPTMGPPGPPLWTGDDWRAVIDAHSHPLPPLGVGGDAQSDTGDGAASVVGGSAGSHHSSRKNSRQRRAMRARSNEGRPDPALDCADPSASLAARAFVAVAGPGPSGPSPVRRDPPAPDAGGVGTTTVTTKTIPVLGGRVASERSGLSPSTHSAPLPQVPAHPMRRPALRPSCADTRAPAAQITPQQASVARVVAPGGAASPSAVRGETRRPPQAAGLPPAHVGSRDAGGTSGRSVTDAPRLGDARDGPSGSSSRAQHGEHGHPMLAAARLSAERYSWEAISSQHSARAFGVYVDIGAGSGGYTRLRKHLTSTSTPWPRRVHLLAPVHDLDDVGRAHALAKIDEEVCDGYERAGGVPVFRSVDCAMFTRWSYPTIPRASGDVIVTACSHSAGCCTCEWTSRGSAPRVFFSGHSLYYLTGEDLSDLLVGDWMFSVVHRFTPGAEEGFLGTAQGKEAEYRWTRGDGRIVMHPSGRASKTYDHPDIEPMLERSYMEVNAGKVVGVEDRADAATATAVWRWVVVPDAPVAGPAVRKPLTPHRHLAAVDLAVFQALMIKGDSVKVAQAIASCSARLARMLSTEFETVTVTQTSSWVKERLPVVRKLHSELAEATGRAMDVGEKADDAVHYPPFLMCLQFAIGALMLMLGIVYRFRTIGVLLVVACFAFVAAIIAIVTGWKVAVWCLGHHRVRPHIRSWSPIQTMFGITRVLILGPTGSLMLGIIDVASKLAGRTSGNG